MELINKLESIEDILIKDKWDLKDEYHRGMYNGLELARSILANETPDYVDASNVGKKLKEDHALNSESTNSRSYNSGIYNSGIYNSGDYNSGEYNSGDFNSGYYNSGYYNSGSANSGNFNSGDFNSGHYNSGKFNKCNYSVGIFCTEPSPLYIFNKLSDKKRDEIDLPQMHGFYLNRWVNEFEMTKQEKVANPKFKLTKGYLKTYSWKEAWLNYWNNADEKEKKKFLALPNFDSDIFKEITGVDVNDNSYFLIIEGKKYKLIEEK